MEYTTITYVGRTPGYIAKVGNSVYEFEWNKSLGIGKRQGKGEVNPSHISKIANWRDKKGRKIFRLDKIGGNANGS
jgi:hypothetical protein